MGASGILAALILAGCGNNNPGTSTKVTRVALVTTERLELAFFTARGNAIYDLGLADDRGKRLRILTGESLPGTVLPQLFTNVSWSPDGRRLAFAGVEGRQTDEHDEPTDIYVMDSDGSESRQITDVGNARGPLWSPDGETIIFTRTSRGGDAPLRGSLWSVKLDGSELLEVAEADNWETYGAGSFSPDGSQLVVTRAVLDPDSGNASSDVYVMDPDGTGQRKLIERASSPAFSYDGSRLAFVSDRDRNGQLCYGDRCFYGAELYVANADGSDPRRLTETEALNEAHPSWSVDDSRIAYQRGEVFENAEAMSILEVNPDGTCEHEILTGSGAGVWYARPAWRPSEPRQGGGSLEC